MNNLKELNLFKLSTNVKIYVPSTEGLNGEMEEKKHYKIVNEVQEKMTELFGGATSMKAYGMY